MSTTTSGFFVTGSVSFDFNVGAGTGSTSIEIREQYGFFGFSVASAGDLNGDGLDDFIMGQPGGSQGGPAAFVVFGTTDASFGILVEIRDAGLGGEDGRSVSSAGDLNGDGLSDLVIGAPRENVPRGGAGGAAYVVFGRADGFSAGLDLDDVAAGTGGFVIQGPTGGAFAGQSLASAGDVNGDGIDDLLVAAPGARPLGRVGAGETYVVFGRAGGFDAPVDLVSVAAGTGGFVIRGAGAGDQGSFLAGVGNVHVGSAGDVNGDGLKDIIIGARYADGPGQGDSGAAYVVFGRKDGFATPVDLQDVAAGSGGFLIRGAAAGDRAGFSVASAGDFNGDGIADLVIGAPDVNRPGAVSAGAAYIVFGRAGGFAAPLDLADVAAGRGGFMIHGGANLDGVGFSVASGGDVNGDGFDDVLVWALNGGVNLGSGAGYVVFGRAAGPTLPINTAALTTADGVRPFLDRYGGVREAPVASAGDVNGDGFADYLVGSPDSGDDKPTWTLPGFFLGGSGGVSISRTVYSQNVERHGRTWAFFGGDRTLSVTHAGDAAANALTGTAGADVMVAGRGNDTMDGGAGGADAFTAGAGNDLVILRDLGFRRVDGGSGTDTLRLGTGGMVLDLAGIADMRLQGIEAIDLAGGGTTLKLTAREVMNLSDTTNTLRVTGGAGDTVTLLDTGWTEGATVGGVRMLTNGGATLRLDAAIALLGRPPAVDLAALGPEARVLVLQGAAARDQAGMSVASAGDVDGDGLDDLLVGAPFADPADRTEAGTSFLVFGRALGPSMGVGTTLDLAAILAGGTGGTAGVPLLGAAFADRSGTSVASAGDLNGDGRADLVIGSPEADRPLAMNAGAVHVVLGPSDGFPPSLDLASIAPGTGFTLPGGGAAEQVGLSVASAGDVNGDGLSDFIVGAPLADLVGRADSGATYVVFGRADALPAFADIAFAATGTGGFVLRGAAGNDLSGFSVASAGDVNADGLADIVIGTPTADPLGRTDAGAAYVVFGRTGGFASSIELSAVAAGAGGFAIQGAAAGDFAGWSVASAGDVNGDGIADIVIGARNADPAGRTDAGAAYVVFGRTAGFTAPIDLSAIAAGQGGFMVRGMAADDFAGSAVASAGDLNGDGIDDLVIGMPFADPLGRHNAGAAYVLFGQAGGFDRPVDPGSITEGTLGFLIQGVYAGNTAGRSVAAAGDVDGDGFADLIIGAPSAAVAGRDVSGAAYLIFGRDFTRAVTHAGDGGANALTGTALADAMVGGLGADTLDGGSGGADALSGGEGNDLLVIRDLGFRRVDGGSGADTLRLGGNGLVLNLAQLGDLRVQGIEAIDLAGGGNALRLSVQEVLNLSDTTNALRVTGGAGDTLALLDGGWTIGAVVGGVRTLTNGRATVQVDAAVAVAPVPPPVDLATLGAATGGFVLQGMRMYDRASWSLASAGDLNGDGFADLVIAAPYTQAPVVGGNGTAYVIFGKPGGFASPVGLASAASGTGGFAIQGVVAGEFLGASGVSAGDVNGDGISDLIMGAPGVSPGRTYVVFGRAEGFAAPVNLTAVAAGAGGFAVEATYSSSVASAGDINGDGFADIVIGGANLGAAREGLAYVVFGRAGGVTAQVSLADVTAGIGGVLIQGVARDDMTGFSVASAGDVNGDGLDDLVIGADGSDPAGQSYAGAAYVVFGRADGFASPVNLGTITAGGDGFVIRGAAAGDRAGFSVAAAGDINGDGIADIAVGANASPDGRTFAGAAYVVFGRAGGFQAPVELSEIGAGSDGFLIKGAAAGDEVGRVASAGDVNGDGIDDLIIAMAGADPLGRTDAGAAYVLFGRAGGFAAPVDLAVVAAGTGGFLVQGAALGDRVGGSLASAGDLDGDGFADLVIGAAGADPAAGTDAGAGYVLFGRDFSQAVTHAGNAADNALTGTAGADAMVGGRGADTMDGGSGGADAFAGGEGNDLVILRDLGFRRVEGGSGTDTLRLGGDGLALDLTAIADLRLQGIEAIDLAGGGNTLKLTAREVMNLSDTTNTLRVLGGAADRLELLDGGWTQGGIVAGARVLTKGAATLLVAPTIATDLVFTSIADVASLVGGAGNDTLVGGAENDTLDGAAGADSLSGGLGDDEYLVTSPSDAVEEPADGGQDRVVASVSWTLGDHVEWLVLTGTGGLAGIGNALANRLDGNGGANLLDGAAGHDVLNGEAGNDTLDGGADDDLLDGGEGDDGLLGGFGTDTLWGGAGNDALDGGEGADSLVGGAGDDRYQLDSAGDVVLEAADAGTDWVFASVSWTLGDTLEWLTLAGTADLAGIGNALANRVDGNDGANLLAGLGGNDTLVGAEGGDTLIGGAGTDSLVGGEGNDLYLIHHAGGDTVVEQAGGGVDRIVSSLSWTLDAEIEQLRLWGLAPLQGTGNEFANLLLGNAGANLLSGEAGADTLNGGAGDDSLSGGDGNDLLRGGTGADSLSGGNGDDTLAGESGAALLSGDDGSDLLLGWSANDTLRGGADSDTLHGQAGLDALQGDEGNDLVFGGDGHDTVDGGNGDDTLNGNGGDDLLLGGSGGDRMRGGAGADTLVGGEGADTLAGGTGGDVFVYGSAAEGGDRLWGFSAAEDEILVSALGFGGGLVAGAALVYGVSFVASVTGGAAAGVSTGQFLFNTTTRLLSWDADGDGLGGAVPIARTAVLITSADVTIIA